MVTSFILIHSANMSGKTEKLTMREQWSQVKTGDKVYSRRTLQPRLVINGHNGFVILQKLRGVGTTTYVDCDRGNFILGGNL